MCCGPCIACGVEEPDHHCTKEAEALYAKRLKAMERRLDRDDDIRPAGRDWTERLGEGFAALRDDE